MGRFRKTKESRLVFVLVAIAMSLITLNACLKDSEGVNQVSAVRALNAVPGSTGLDIGLDQNQINERLLGEEFAYGDTLPYKNAWPGRRLVRIFDPIRNAATPPLVQGTVDFVPGRFYSLYVAGSKNIQLMATEDDLSAPGEGKAKIRFIHLSPDAPSLDFGIEGADALLASDKAFMTVVGFSTIDAGETYTFNIIAHDSGDVLHAFEFTPENDMIYTVWAKGLVENTTKPALGFGHGIITH